MLRLPHDVRIHTTFADQCAWPADLDDRRYTMRDREVAAGRHCARRALEKAGFSGQAPLIRTADGPPAWPAGWVGCISHCSDGAVAAATRSGSERLLGIDVENIMDDAIAAQVTRSIATDQETALLPEFGAGARSTLIFSAKETLYKALFPSVRQFFDFSAARVVQACDRELVLALTVDWNTRFARGWHTSVRYAVFDRHVVTLLTSDRARSPS